MHAASLSPDGRHVAYSISRTDSEEHFETWITELQGGERRQLLYPGNAKTPRWSPDGRTLAFIGDGRLHVAAFPTLAISPALTPAHSRVMGPPSWSPDSAGLAVSLLERRVIEGPRRITSAHFRMDGLGFLDGTTQHIYTVNIADGALHRLTSDLGICSQPEWSTCGRRILFFAGDGTVPYSSSSQRLLTVDLADGEIQEVLGSRWYVECARWLPDGEHIAVAAACDSTLTVPTASLWVVNRSGNDAQLRTPGLAGHVGFRINHDMPARELTGGNAITILNRQTAFATVQRGGRAEIWRIALAGDIATMPVVCGERSCLVLGAHQPSDTLLSATTDLRSPTQLCCSTLNGRNERRLVTLNDDVLDRWPAVDIEPMTFQSADGLEIESWFMAPADCRKPLPTVLFIHGGPFAATGHAFRYDFRLLASRGFGVAFANFRGSAGYGEPFVRAIMGDWGGRGYPDHMATVDTAIARGYADPQRLAVWGPSHGGFATCWIVGHTHRFKAAVAEAAFVNFQTLYYLSDVPEVFARDLGGRPHEIPEIYRARSPITYAHHCTTPTLLLHGEDDLRCPISEAEQFHRALKDAGCATELLRIPGCSHLGDAIGPLSAREAQNRALLGWFSRYL